MANAPLPLSLALVPNIPMPEIYRINRIYVGELCDFIENLYRFLCRWTSTDTSLERNISLDVRRAFRLFHILGEYSNSGISTLPNELIDVISKILGIANHYINGVQEFIEDKLPSFEEPLTDDQINLLLENATSLLLGSLNLQLSFMLRLCINQAIDHTQENGYIKTLGNLHILSATLSE
ncbi:hypothetical protein H4219_006354, partial [Mycoemilia scoparia]